MIPRQIKPGLIVLVDENEAWRELLIPGSGPSLPKEGAGTPIYPGSDALCTVVDLSERPGERPPSDRNRTA